MINTLPNMTATLASGGLYPGESDFFAAAVMGSYRFEIIVTPSARPGRGSGGSAGFLVPYRLPKRKVHIKIKMGDREWEQEVEMDDEDAENEEKLLNVEFIKQNLVETRVAFIGSVLNTQNTTIKVKKL